jgi:hypothetical protein
MTRKPSGVFITENGEEIKEKYYHASDGDVISNLESELIRTVKQILKKRIKRKDITISLCEKKSSVSILFTVDGKNHNIFFGFFPSWRDNAKVISVGLRQKRFHHKMPGLENALLQMFAFSFELRKPLKNDEEILENLGYARNEIDKLIRSGRAKKIIGDFVSNDK